MKPYRPNAIALATLHQKERVVAPPFRQQLNAEIIVAEVDTDLLGTFSGEVERKGTMRDAALEKIRLGQEATGLACALASEGSFGPHPAIPLLACDHELLIYQDSALGLTLSESLLSEETNYQQQSFARLEDAADFLHEVRYPSHALILRPEQKWPDAPIFKGIREDEALKKAFAACLAHSDDGKVRIETDMRADANPTRMRLIGQLAERLARRLATPCPACNGPGWGKIRVEKGLPCELCHRPTDWVLHEVSGCALCGHEEKLPRSDGLKAASPMHCGNCNP
jgi:hypothetical protein